MQNIPIRIKIDPKNKKLAEEFYVHETVAEVYAQLCAYLESVDAMPEQFFAPVATEDRFPAYTRIVCFPVSGNNAHYIHISVLAGEYSIKPVFLGKTLRGFDFAARVAAECSRALGA